MIRIIRQISLVLVSLVFLQACDTEVELCYADHPHRATLDIRYDWGEWKEDKKHPDRMYVLAQRIVNNYKYVFSTETKAKGNKGTMLFPLDEQVALYPPKEEVPEEDTPEPETPEDGEEVTPTPEPGNGESSEQDETTNPMPDEDMIQEVRETVFPPRPSLFYSVQDDTTEEPEEPEAPEEPEESEEEIWHKMRIRNGEYRFLAFNCDTEVFDIEGLEEFEKDPAYDIERLHLKYKAYPLSELDASKEEVPGYQAWEDYNPYADFVGMRESPIFYAEKNNIKVTYNQTVVLDFKPQPVTQKITVKFTINKERGVRIERLLGDMAGIPSGIQLSTGYLDTEKTYKKLFAVTFPENNDNATTVNCSGELNVTSIIRSNDGGLITGPGVLQLVIYTSAEDPEEPTKRKYKTIQCVINLRNTLTRAALVKWAEDEEHVIQNKKEAVLDIQSILKIEKGEIVESDDDTGLDRWKTGGNIDIDA